MWDRINNYACHHATSCRGSRRTNSLVERYRQRHYPIVRTEGGRPSYRDRGRSQLTHGTSGRVNLYRRHMCAYANRVVLPGTMYVRQTTLALLFFLFPPFFCEFFFFSIVKISEGLG